MTQGPERDKPRNPAIDSTDDKPARKPKRRRRQPELGSWAQEIYSAPRTDDEQRSDGARVTVSTRIRKPKVHLMAPATPSKVDLARYMGRWYEIARLPYFTERRCVNNVTADYLLGDDGMVHVTNRCNHKDGEVGQAKALARVVDGGRNARFEISFRTLYGVHILWDDYWIIGLGEDYDYALVGQPTRRRGWVLARDPNPSEDSIQTWLKEFSAQGFPAEDFIRTRQEWA